MILRVFDERRNLLTVLQVACVPKTFPLFAKKAASLLLSHAAYYKHVRIFSRKIIRRRFCLISYSVKYHFTQVADIFLTAVCFLFLTIFRYVKYEYDKRICI
jgi:hypothetical protein